MMDFKVMMNELFYYATQVAENAPDEEGCTKEENEMYAEVVNLINAMQNAGF